MLMSSDSPACCRFQFRSLTDFIFFLTNKITSKVGKVQDTTKVKKNTANAKLEEMKNVNTDFASPKLN